MSLYYEIVFVLIFVIVESLHWLIGKAKRISLSTDPNLKTKDTGANASPQHLNTSSYSSLQYLPIYLQYIQISMQYLCITFSTPPHILLCNIFQYLCNIFKYLCIASSTPLYILLCNIFHFQNRDWFVLLSTCIRICFDSYPVSSLHTTTNKNAWHEWRTLAFCVLVLSPVLIEKKYDEKGNTTATPKSITFARKAPAGFTPSTRFGFRWWVGRGAEYCKDFA